MRNSKLAHILFNFKDFEVINIILVVRVQACFDLAKGN